MHHVLRAGWAYSWGRRSATWPPWVSWPVDCVGDGRQPEPPVPGPEPVQPPLGCEAASSEPFLGVSPLRRTPRPWHRLHLALAAAATELVVQTGGEGEPPSSGVSGHGQPPAAAVAFLAFAPLPALWTLMVDTHAWRGPSLGPSPASLSARRLSAQPRHGGLPHGPCPRARQTSLSHGPRAFCVCSLCIPLPHRCSAAPAPGHSPAQGPSDPHG